MQRSRRGGHIDPATGRNRRDDGPRRTRDGESLGGGIRRQNGRPAESRAEWRRRNKIRPVRGGQAPAADTREPWERGSDAASWHAG